MNPLSAARGACSLIVILLMAAVFLPPPGDAHAAKLQKNNNPGAIRASKFTKVRQAPDLDRDGFANFKSAARGFRAVVELLRTKRYARLTIKQAIHRWAPVEDSNKPLKYTAYVCKATGLPPGARVGSLSAGALASLAWAITEYEGWHARRRK